VSGVGEIFQPVAMAGSAQFFVSESKILGMRQVTPDALHAGLGVHAALPLFEGTSVTVAAYGRVDIQLHEAVFGMAFDIGTVTGLARHSAIGVGALSLVEVSGVAAETFALFKCYTLGAGELHGLVNVYQCLGMGGVVPGLRLYRVALGALIWPCIAGFGWRGQNWGCQHKTKQHN
jgi:hypothetical protein